MEETSKKLYPMRFVEKEAEMPWGQVCYQIADLGAIDSMVYDGWLGGNNLSELMGTFLERVVGDDAFEFYGLQFPILVKVMKTSGRQPLQINAADDVAEERYDSFGKTAFWFVKEASEDASLFLGLNRDVEAGEFYRRCKEGTAWEILNEIHPKAGDCFVIKPGTVHAAGPGLTIVEISECSELSFNLETELEEAFDLIDFHRFVSPAALTPRSTSASRTPPPTTSAVPPLTWPRVATVAEGSMPSEDSGKGCKLAECDEFKVTKFDLENPLHIFSDQPGSFAIYHCISGEAFVQAPTESGGYENYPLKAGASILVPSEVNDFMLFPAADKTVLLEATVERRTLPDSYTDGKPADDTPDPHVRQWN